MKPVAFEVPGEAITLKPFENQTFGIKGVAPDGWKEESPGIFQKSASTALLQQALPGTREVALQLLANQFKLATTPASAGERKTDTLTWNLYAFKLQGQPVDLALAEKGGKTYLVLLASEQIDHKSLYDQVFLPAIDAYTVTG
jgi:hypothetical protein